MISLFNRPSTTTLDCFTYRADVHDLHPVAAAIKHIPKWWKDLPAFDETDLAPQNTMKKCRGFIDLYDKSFVIPMWSDLVINYTADSLQYQFADSLSEMANHNMSQRRGFLPNNIDVKIVSPWLFKSKDEINWMTVKPMYNYPEEVNFDVCHGVVNFKYQSVTNMNIILNRVNENTKFVIEAGQPIWQMIPMTERKVVVKTHLVNRDEFLRIKEQTNKVKFVGSYNYTKKILQEKESKCPFGFGK
jgi:hypothetical protein